MWDVSAPPPGGLDTAFTKLECVRGTFSLHSFLLLIGASMSESPPGADTTSAKENYSVGGNVSATPGEGQGTTSASE